MPRADILSFEEIERLARLFAQLGVDKIRLTGGEPTTRKGLPDLVERLRGIEGVDRLLLTTNGAAMRSLARPLRTAGIDGVNISLDTLDPERFLQITRRDQLNNVLDGIDASLEAGYDSVKINVVVMADVNDDELCQFLHHFRHRPVEVRFIEFMPFVENGWKRGKMMPYADMRNCIEKEFCLTPVPTESSAVAKEFLVQDASVRVGFITSMTEHFCDGCNRLRLTSDGRLKVCLFGKTGPSLRDLIRSGATDDEITEAIRVELDGKWAGHPAMTRLVESNDRPMITIGG